MLKIITFKSLQAGPHLLILGAVHGNEVCGTKAIQHIISLFESGTLALQKGQISFVPICNPRAYAAGQRFIERNLNRHLVPQEQPDCYEAELGNILCPLITSCDALLDLHSSPRGNAPYLFVGPRHKLEYDFAKALGIKWMLTGWEETYAEHAEGTSATPLGQSSSANQSGPVKPADPTEGIGTEQAARNAGRLAVLVECGDHTDPRAAAVAERAIYGAMAHFELLDQNRATAAIAAAEKQIGANAAPRNDEPCLLQMRKVWFRTDKGTCAQDWQDFMPVLSGTLLATRANGEEIRAPQNGFVILPHPDAPVGQEWFYFCTQENMPA